ncbi:MAG: DegT/DnrJ/EryC1/StrS family aminotransferase [Sedimenticolaceae bacterium]
MTLDRQPALAQRSRVAGPLTNAHRVADEVISLPMHPYLSEDEMRQITDAVCDGLH